MQTLLRTLEGCFHGLEGDEGDHVEKTQLSLIGIKLGELTVRYGDITHVGKVLVALDEGHLSDGGSRLKEEGARASLFHEVYLILL